MYICIYKVSRVNHYKNYAKKKTDICSESLKKYRPDKTGFALGGRFKQNEKNEREKALGSKILRTPSTKSVW